MSKSAKKVVGILTYHTGYNYGASLQAFALSSIIKKMGIECEIINFETKRFVASREMFSRRPVRPKELIKTITRLPYFRVLRERERLFDTFTNTYLPISPLYRTEEDVISHSEDYECIVCGSDQIWNLSQKDAPAANLLFYLNFPKRQRRVSYAASFGKWVHEASSMADTLIPLLNQFDYISVREKSGVELLRSFGISSHLSLDPTLLLDKEDYDGICRERLIEGPYILLFSWSCGNDVVRAARKIQKEIGLELVSITPPPRTMFTGIKRKLDIGPREFLSMIKYADFVVTDSFHGTAFSTIYEKSFVSVVSNKEADPRMKSLLDQLGLEDHFVDPDNISIKRFRETDYNSVKMRKKSIICDSLDYLKNSLMGLNSKND